MLANRHLPNNSVQLILLLLLSAGAAFGSPSDQASLDPLSHAARAREAVREELRKEGLPLEDLAITLIGEPLFPPEHAHMHTSHPSAAKQPSPESNESRESASEDIQLPQALALALVMRQDEVVRTCLVRFRSGTPEADCAQALGSDTLPLSIREYEQVSSELIPFYDVAVDITKGPERFYPYLPSNIRKHLRYPGEDSWLIISGSTASQLSDQELRQLASLMLDMVAHYMWLYLEGYEIDPWFDDLENGGESAEGVRKMISTLSKVLARMNQELRDIGALAPDHLAAVRPYLRRVLGEGLLVKVSNAEGLYGAPPSADLYVTRIATYACFARLDGRLQLVFLVMAD